MTTIMRMTISIVGVEDDLVRRIGMAVKLLGTAEFDARIEPWDGSRRDILVADLQDAYGTSAVSVAQRRGDTVVGVVKSGDAVGVTRAIAANTQVAELTRLFRELALLKRNSSQVAVANDASSPSSSTGLLGACLANAGTGGDFVAKSGPFALVIRKTASRVTAASHSDLASGRSRFVDFSWTVDPIGKPASVSGDAAVTVSLDAFLIEASEANEAKLPLLGGQNHRLSSWPDLGSLPDNTDALRLSSALLKRAWSVRELAASCNVNHLRANAFCWAMRASGLLVSDVQVQEKNQIQNQAPSSRSLSAPVRSIVVRLAQRFGLRLGAGNSHD